MMRFNPAARVGAVVASLALFGLMASGCANSSAEGVDRAEAAATRAEDAARRAEEAAGRTEKAAASAEQAASRIERMFEKQLRK